MMEMPGVLSEAIGAFAVLPDRRSRLEYLIELGEGLSYDGSVVREENRIQGCVSSVFVSGSLDSGRMVYSGWADSLIMRGFLRLLCEAFSGVEPRGIVEESEEVIRSFVDETHIDASLIESRANSFGTIYARMRSLAQVYV